MTYNLRDKICVNNDEIVTNKLNDRNSCFWAKTRIMGGYGLHKNQYGVSDLDEVVFDTSNIVPVGGVQYAMEMIFGVLGPVSVPTLDGKYQIGAQNSTLISGDRMPYQYGQKVCLFGIGCEGAADNNLTVKEAKYTDFDVNGMIPFRYTNDALSDTDRTKYWGQKVVNNINAYYLKSFDGEPEIYHLYKNGVDGSDGSSADTDSIYNSSSEIGIETFTQVLLTITKDDVREWFEIEGGNIEVPRVNSIGLFTAIYDSQKNDYANIKLFSKLNIPTEPLSLSKDMNIIYRVYGS